MKVIDKDVIEFVSEKTGMPFSEAQHALHVTDKEIEIVLNGENDHRHHLIEHQLTPVKAELRKIAQTLHLPENEFSSWTEDDMVWVLYGENIVEGIAGEGPTPKLAIADFYRRWYERKIRRQ